MARASASTAMTLAAVLAACGGDGNDGDEWSPISGLPETYGYLDVWAFASDDVWLLDGSDTIQRWDGEGFEALTTESSRGVSCIFALSRTEVYLCAGDALLFYDGSAFALLEGSDATSLSGISDTWASSPSDVWMVGDDALAAHYDGSTWTTTNIGASFNSSVWGSGMDDVYVMGTFDLVHYDGSSWSEVDVDAGDGQVWGTSADDVWVMTDTHELSHYFSGTWETIETDFVGDLAAVWGPRPDALWGAGTAGSIARYDGREWSELTHQRIGAPYLRQLVAVHGTPTGEVWAVGTELGEGGGKGIAFRRPAE